MTVRVYRSSDASAPSLTGQVGSLTALLDAVLVNGYGSMTAAGWTIAYTATNKRVYTMASGGTGFSCYVDDTGPGAGGAREARISGWEVPSGLGTGTGQFPTTSQMTAPAGALVLRKSTTADSTARAWTIVADGHTFYVFTETGDATSPLMAFTFVFGDFFSYASSDAYNCIIIGRTIENNGTSGTSAMSLTSGLYEPFPQINPPSGTPLASTIMGHYIARNFNGVGSSINCGKHSDNYKKAASGNTGSNVGRNGTWANGNADTPSSFPYPSPPNSGLFLAPLWLHHGGFVRGYLKGLWDPCHYLALNHNDSFSGSGNMAGKTLLAQQLIGVASANGFSSGPAQIVVETSDTWS